MEGGGPVDLRTKTQQRKLQGDGRSGGDRSHMPPPHPDLGKKRKPQKQGSDGPSIPKKQKLERVEDDGGAATARKPDQDTKESPKEPYKVPEGHIPTTQSSS